MEQISSDGIVTKREFSKRLNWMVEGIQIIDFNWRYIYVNDALVAQLNTTKQDLLDHTIMEIYPCIEDSDYFKILQSCLIERKSCRIENDFVFPDQSKKWFAITIEAVEEGICILSLDITEHKETEEKLLKATHLFSFLSQVNQKIVRIKNQDDLFDNACKMAIKFGKFRMAWIGIFDKMQHQIMMADQSGIPENEMSLFSTIPIQSHQEKVLQTDRYYICNDVENDIGFENYFPFLQKYEIRSCIILPIHKSGTIIGTFNLYATEAIFFDTDEIAILVELSADISFALDLLEKDKIQEETTKELMKINAELDRFVYSTSHDLRAPLTSIMGLVAIIEDETSEPDTLDHAKMIKGRINRLDEFIKNILSYSQNSRTELEIEKIPVQSRIKEIIDSFHNIKNAANINFELVVSEKNIFFSDLNRFNILMENLISNAIKYHDPAKPKQYIRINVNIDSDQLILAISDNGIGISKEYHTKIYEMFFRLSSSTESTGLGLYIVKEIIGKLQGEITVSSTEGEGTTFHIKLKNFTNER